MTTSNKSTIPAPQSTLAGKIIFAITGLVCLLYSYGFCKAVYDVNSGVTRFGAIVTVMTLDPISAQGYKAGVKMYIGN
jgi:hypothetical protein